MKIPSSRSPHSTIPSHLGTHAWGLRSPSVALLAALVLALVQGEDVRLKQLASQLPGTATLDSKIKQVHRFFKRFPDDVLARFVLPFAPSGEWQWLVIDRTNWPLGTSILNILVVAVILKGHALPLMWTLLPHGGSSIASLGVFIYRHSTASGAGRCASKLLILMSALYACDSSILIRVTFGGACVQVINDAPAW